MKKNYYDFHNFKPFGHKVVNNGANVCNMCS